MKQCYFLLLVLIFSIFYCSGQDSPIRATQINNTQETDTTKFNEAKAYKLLYENQVKSNDAILKTIFYALGGLGTAMLLVFASNWWFNDKKVRDVINEIDSKINGVKKDAFTEVTEKINTLSTGIISDLNQAQSKLQEEVTANITNVTLKFTDFTEKIRAEIKEDNKILSENYQKQLESFNENYQQQISVFTESFNSQYSNIKEIFSGKEHLLRELILSEQNNRTDQTNNILQKIFRVEFYMWKDSGVFRNAFVALLEEQLLMLNKKTIIPHSFLLPLNQMSDILDKCTYILTKDKERAVEMIARIPENDELIETISKKLEKISLKD